MNQAVDRRPFIPGLELSELFYVEAVRPLMAAHFPGLPYSAARLGFGSDVLGFDTPTSRDHDWGPRLTLFVRPEDWERHRSEIDAALSRDLPPAVHGYPTGFTYHDDGTTGMNDGQTASALRHQVQIQTLRSWLQDYLRYDPAQPPAVRDWLRFPQQRLRTIASGRVFYDGLGELEAVRVVLRYYPRDVWLYLMAAQWRRIGQEEPFVGRAGDVGDELGSRLIAARLVMELMRLCFLIERQYAPYGKWFGTAFARLDCAPTLTPIMRQVLDAHGWRERERHLSAAYEAVAGMHNALQVTSPRPAQVTPFYSRPYLVIHGDDLSDALRAAIVDPEVRALPPHLGSVNQWVDSTDVLDMPAYLEQLGCLYEAST